LKNPSWLVVEDEPDARNDSLSGLAGSTFVKELNRLEKRKENHDVNRALNLNSSLVNNSFLSEKEQDVGEWISDENHHYERRESNESFRHEKQKEEYFKRLQKMRINKFSFNRKRN
jgi:hypothetical protein